VKVVVVGSGAREHALAHVLGRSADVVVTPGNAGTDATTPSGHRITSSAAPAEELEGDLFVIGPEVPLVDGLADRLRARGRLVLGPGADGARLEGSKAFMKQLAASAGVPTARFGVFDEFAGARDFLAQLAPPYVVKTDGLAAGKGVLVTFDHDEALRDVADKLSGASFGDAGQRVVIEEALTGPEVTLLVLTDGTRAVALPLAQDYKRIGDGDAGPNTGGMGAYSPVPVAGPEVADEIMARIVEPTLRELRRRGIDYRGVLYVGCMLGDDGPQLVEFNVRFGDPEAEVVLPRLVGDVAALLTSVAAGRLLATPEVSDEVAVGVVVAAPGYPAAPVLGDVIDGVDQAGTVEGVTVFHAGTRRADDATLRSAGGRVLVLSALGADFAIARARAYEAVSCISLRDAQYRRDIAAVAAQYVGESR
jgi:phosphoribosylamine--glycine ligase